MVREIPRAGRGNARPRRAAHSVCFIQARGQHGVPARGRGAALRPAPSAAPRGVCRANRTPSPLQDTPHSDVRKRTEHPTRSSSPPVSPSAEGETLFTELAGDAHVWPLNGTICDNNDDSGVPQPGGHQFSAWPLWSLCSGSAPDGPAAKRAGGRSGSARGWHTAVFRRRFPNAVRI